MNYITAQAKMTPLAAAALVARRGGDADTSLTIMAQICPLLLESDDLDNALAESWFCGDGYGTPGLDNADNHVSICCVCFF